VSAPRLVKMGSLSARNFEAVGDAGARAGCEHPRNRRCLQH